MLAPSFAWHQVYQSVDFFLCFFVFRLAILYILCYNSYVNGKEVSMKWTDIVTAISSVVSNIIALAALIISIRRRPRHKR